MKTTRSQSELLARLTAMEPLLNATAVFIMATVFLYWDGSRAAYVLLSLAAFAIIVIYRPRMPREQRLYSWPIYGFVGAATLSMIFNGMQSGGVNVVTSRYFLLLLAVPLVSVFYLSFDARRNVWIKFAVACVVFGGIALYDILILGENRAGVEHNPSAFGFAALTMTSIVLGSYFRFSQARYGRAVFFLAISMGVCAIILSGTRSSWLAGLVVLVIALFVYLDRYSISRRLLFALGLIGIVAIVASTVPLVQERIGKMADMVTPYVKDEEQRKFNSLRYRVEAWKLGWHVGMENKVFGFGPGNTKDVIDDYAKQNREVRGVGRLNHLHNQFLQSFAMTGLVGLFSLLAMFGCHFWIFGKYLGKRYSLEVRCLALSGVLLMVSYLLKSIPGVPFYGRQYLMMYGFASASIWGCLLGALRHSGQAGHSSAAEAN